MRRLSIILLSGILFLSVFTGCSGRPEYSIDMIMVPVKPQGMTWSTGMLSGKTAEKNRNPYSLGKSEVSWSTWKKVYDWATEDDGSGLRADGGELYVFANPGSRVNPGEDSPVTMITWIDAIVWCNAFTEYYNFRNGTGLKCVYYSDPHYTTPIRSSTYRTDGAEYPFTPDHPYILSSYPANTDMNLCASNGYRLPAEWEWEMASRWKEVRRRKEAEVNTGDNSCKLYSFTPGYFTTPGNSPNSAYTVSSSPNALGIIGMNGNVWEFCYDWYVPGYRSLRGGSWSNGSISLPVGQNRILFAPYDKYDGIGFRVAQSVLFG